MQDEYANIDIAHILNLYDAMHPLRRQQLQESSADIHVVARMLSRDVVARLWRYKHLLDRGSVRHPKHAELAAIVYAKK